MGYDLVGLFGRECLLFDDERGVDDRLYDHAPHVFPPAEPLAKLVLNAPSKLTLRTYAGSLCPQNPQRTRASSQKRSYDPQETRTPRLLRYRFP